MNMQKNMQAFLRELSELGRRHGFGLTGAPQLFELELEDRAFEYTTDADGVITLGSASVLLPHLRGSKQDADPI